MAKEEDEALSSSSGESEESEETEESGETENSEESGEEEEEEEPKLKYHRLGFSVTEILNSDVATCLSAHSRFLALGTKKGKLIILDFDGNKIKEFGDFHSGGINDISIDEAGEFVASCSSSGIVIIAPFLDTPTEKHSVKRPVLAVALDPLYQKNGNKEFVFGGKSEELILNKKGMLFGSKFNVLHAGEGPIYSIKWRKNLIAWSNNSGVKIFDCQINQKITYINRPPNSPPPDAYRCCLCWEADDLLLIGWADTIKLAKIVERRNASGPSKYVEIIRFIQTDYWICGLAPFDGGHLVTLAYTKESQPGNAERPELKMITKDNQEISSDALGIHSYEHYSAKSYRLDYMTTESIFYIVAENDIIVAKPRDLDDHITWLLKHQKYEEALQEASKNQAIRINHSIIDIGERYLTYLVENNKIRKATALCPKILGNSEKLWEKWIYNFARLRQLKAICPYIPIANPQLPTTIYELILGFFLNHNPPGFLRTIEEWPPHLYSISSVIAAAEKKALTNSDDSSLKQALAQLYFYDKQFEKALNTYLILKMGRVFELIYQHDLFHAIEDQVNLLIQFNSEEAIKLLINHTDRIPVQKVVTQLKDNRYLQYKYLHALFMKDPNLGRQHHELLLSLYADFDYSHLMPFLKHSNVYSLSYAKQLFEEKKLYPELIYILGITGGQSETALKLIIEELKNVKMAIEFVQEQNDENLWDSLISMSISNPTFLSGLLEHIGAHVDPLKLIKRIPTHVHIEGLRDRLVKIINDYNLQMSLREGCNVILKADAVSLSQKLHVGQCAAMKVSTQTKCASCSNQVIPAKEQAGLVIFFCSHVYHQRCLRSAAEGVQLDLHDLWCIICQKESQQGKKAKIITPKVVLGGAPR